jgi:malate dehydrogenase (oxaloacetate-decarboxylating)
LPKLVYLPRLALGIIDSRARPVTDTMVKAAATELVRHLPTQTDKEASLLRPISRAHELGRMIAQAVGKQAIQDGQVQVAEENSLLREVDSNIWPPIYAPYERGS